MLKRLKNAIRRLEKMTDIVRVAGAQIDIKLGDKAGNLRKMTNCCRKAAEKGAHIIIFPELTLTGYNIDDPSEIPPLAEPVPGPATNEIQKICQDLDILVLFGLIERNGKGSEFFNSVVLIDSTGVAGAYPKILKHRTVFKLWEKILFNHRREPTDVFWPGRDKY